MKRIVWLTVAGLLGLSSLMTGNAVNTCDHPYFPIRNGARWTYESRVQGMKSRQYTQTIEQLSGNTFVMRQSVGATSILYKWTCDGKGLSSPDYGAVSTSNSQFKLEVVSFSGVTFPSASSWVIGRTWTASYKVRGQMMGAAQGQVTGDIKQTWKIVGEENVVVKAGAFRAFKVVLTQAMNMNMTLQNRSAPFNNTFEGSAWYARGVGLVKSSFQGSSIQLLAYKP
jgi:hypothetical protein